MNGLTLSEYSNIASLISVLVAAGALIVAWKQLSKLSNDLRMNSLMAVLEIESEMNSRKEKVDNLISKIKTLELEGKLTNDLKDILKDDLNCALENWFNSVDRLAYCILKEYLEDRNWRSEYRPYIAEIVENNESFFGPGSKYTNIIDINERWKRH